MLRFARALTLPLALMLTAAPALADWQVKDALGATITLCGKSSNGVVIPCHVLTDLTGAPIGLASTAPLHVTLDSNGVTIAALPALPAGANAIGTVGVTSLPALAAGTATIGSINNISGTISLPTGAATATNQVTANTSLASIDAKTPALAALPTLANQAAAVASLGTIATNTAGLATAAGQTATNTKLDTIAGQAAPTSLPGTSIGATTGVPGFQFVTGGVAIDTVVKGTGADIGGTITAGGTAQQLMAANTARRGWHFENQSTGPLYVNCSATATADYHSMLIPAGAWYESSTVFTGSGACSIIGATTGQAFYARQF